MMRFLRSVMKGISEDKRCDIVAIVVMCRLYSQVRYRL